VTSQGAIGAPVLMLALLLASAGSRAADPEQTAPPAQPAAPSGQTVPAPRHARHPSAKDRLDERVRSLTKALDLSPAQQAQLRKLLLQQRDEIKGVWDDASIPASDRIGATQAISERTADRIRAMLTDEQKKKYGPPPSERPPRPDSSTVEKWMNPTKPH